jgi:hypothetical protein
MKNTFFVYRKISRSTIAKDRSRDLITYIYVHYKATENCQHTIFYIIFECWISKFSTHWYIIYRIWITDPQKPDHEYLNDTNNAGY